MLLRSITKHVKTQNWLAVALDFVIVVVGVYLGIQVNNWNVSRLDDERSRTIHERLISDFLAIESDALDALEYTVAGFLAVQTLANALIEDPASLALPENTALAEAAFTVRGPVQGSSTYSELVGAGELGLLRSESLIRALSAYERNLRVFWIAANLVGNEQASSPTVLPLSSSMTVLSGATGNEGEALRDQIRILAANPTTLSELMTTLEGKIWIHRMHSHTLEDARNVLEQLGVSPSSEQRPELPTFGSSGQ